MFWLEIKAGRHSHAERGNEDKRTRRTMIEQLSEMPTYETYKDSGVTRSHALRGNADESAACGALDQRDNVLRG
ncbi:MAG: hypothetical protein PHY54_12290 [Methylococcales bacterium]|nr:hypothetical protein [Methylococcales bacterium]